MEYVDHPSNYKMEMDYSKVKNEDEKIEDIPIITPYPVSLGVPIITFYDRSFFHILVYHQDHVTYNYIFKEDRILIEWSIVPPTTDMIKQTGTSLDMFKAISQINSNFKLEGIFFFFELSQ